MVLCYAEKMKPNIYLILVKTVLGDPQKDIEHIILNDLEFVSLTVCVVIMLLCETSSHHVIRVYWSKTMIINIFIFVKNQ